MIYFKTRQLARLFKSAKAGRVIVDLGVEAVRRWAVKVI